MDVGNEASKAEYCNALVRYSDGNRKWVHGRFNLEQRGQRSEKAMG